MVLDPFGGSGTTFAVCERKRRRWIGVEVEGSEIIIERLECDDVRSHENEDHIEG